MSPRKDASTRFLRLIVGVLLLACFTGIQTASAITEQVHDHGPSHTDCCRICHAGHGSAIQAALVFRLAAPLVTAWQTVVEPSSEIPESQVQFDSSRAPPQ